MFDPNSKKKGEKDSKQRQIVKWANEAAPPPCIAAAKAKASTVNVNVREVQCGDPQCAPIDTVIAFIFGNGRRAMTAIPADFVGVRKQDVDRVIGDMGPELMACLDDKEWAQGPQDLSPQGEAAMDRIAAILKLELSKLPKDEVSAVCAATMDVLEQLEEDATQPSAAQQQALRPIDPHAKILSASQKNDVDAVKAFLAEGISPSYANSLGQTSLHIAAMWGNTAVAKLLVEAGADVHATNQLSAATPLHSAAGSSKDLKGRIECAKLLIAAGGDLEKRDADGAAPWQKVGTQFQELKEVLRPPNAKK